ncbi:MFS transporter [Margalitia sp. FSL K6-0131]|uniref:MFS transporter n=1 Tax=Margalitia sp. FSL K6-0131 TaxID=2954604 RepID=UPI0030F7D3AF
MGEISNKAFEVEKIKPNVNMFARKILIMVTIFCWLSIFVEGYDLVVYGVVLPSLMDPNVWGLSSTQAGAMGSYALLGMFFGSVIGGILSDKFGRKLILIAFLLLLSIMMALTSVSNSPEWFGIFRFIAGIGIGGIVPAASALTTEYSPGKYRSLVYVLMYTGFAFGGVAASISGMLFINNFGWRFLFLIGTFPIILIPFIIKFVPESIKFLKSNQQEDKAHKIITKYQISQDILYEESMEEKSNFLLAFFQENILDQHFFSALFI